MFSYKYISMKYLVFVFALVLCSCVKRVDSMSEFDSMSEADRLTEMFGPPVMINGVRAWILFGDSFNEGNHIHNGHIRCVRSNGVCDTSAHIQKSPM